MEPNSDAKRQDYRKQVKEMGKKEFTLLKMQEYGFWPKNLPTPYERQKNETKEDYQTRKALIREYDSLAAQIARLYEDKKEISQKLRSLTRQYDRTWDEERIRREVSKQILEESVQRRAKRRQEREEAKRRRSQAWLQTKADRIVFIGKGYSGSLCHKETDEAKLAAAGLPVIRDDRELAAILCLEYRELRFFCYHRDVVTADHYHRYTVPKRKGGERRIAAPKPLLKRTQRAILTGILDKVPVSDSAHGFVEGRSVVTGAQAHEAGPALLVNLDIEDFFPTITFPRVRGLFRSFGYSGYVASLLAMLCTYCEREEIQVKGETKYVNTSGRILPQGSPASPMITNLLCRHMDRRIEEAAAQYGFAYSRYADDISLSFSRMPEDYLMRRAVYTVMSIIENEGFRINGGKTRYLRGSTRQVITGVVVNGSEPGVPRDWVRRLRAAVHNASGLREQGVIPDALLREITGKAAWLKMVNPSRYKVIIEQAEALRL